MKKTATLLLGSCLVLQSVTVQSNASDAHASGAAAPDSSLLNNSDFSARRNPYSIRHEQARELLGAKRASQMGETKNPVEVAVYVNRRVKELLPERYRSRSRAVSRTITAQAERYNMDPLFVMALIKRESRFNPTVVGTFGEIGLMQIKPSTALWLLEQGDMTGYTGAHDYDQVREALRDPVQNIKFGTAYLARLRQVFKNRGPLYLTAYNMGAPALKSSLRNGVSPTIYADLVVQEYVAFGLDFAASGFHTGELHHRSIASLTSPATLESASTLVRH